MIDLSHDATSGRDGPAISQVSDLLGVPAETLRSWERRYGIPVVTRSRGGHRRYAEDQLFQLRLMRDEISRGKRAADAALAVRLLLDQDNPERARIDEVMTAVELRDAQAITLLLDESLVEIGLAQTIDAVLMPTLRQAGAWWENGRCDQSQERLLTETARAWLARVRMTPVSPEQTPVLLACGPEDLHTLGIEALAALLAENQCGCRVLRGPTSERALVAAASASSAAAVVVVSQLRSHRRAAIRSMRAVEAAGHPVFYAGNAFALATERRHVPGTHLGDAFATATATLLESLHMVSPTPDLPYQVACPSDPICIRPGPVAACRSDEEPVGVRLAGLPRPD